MIARQFRGFTVAACLMVLAAFGMPDTSWAWERTGRASTYTRRAMKKADVDEGGSYSKTETAYPPDTNGLRWPISVPLTLAGAIRLGEFQQRAHRGTS